ncbi:protein gar2-like [Penaeus chinensis]|uniref:protein gar2-like n=1 Tax=Penaeus chinensis TaxID=139456 RepID=UPI001FB8268D|nr:protein gar2-like [Penaeus chinensis]
MSGNTSPARNNRWTQERMEAEMDTAGDGVAWIDKDIREPENHEPDGGKTGEEIPLATLGPGLSRGVESPQVYSVVNSGEGTPRSSTSEHRGKESSRVYPVVNSAQREPYPGSHMADSVTLWSDVMEELKGLRRDLVRKESRKDSASESSSDNSDNKKRKSRRRKRTTSDEDSCSDTESESLSSGNGKRERRPKRLRKHSNTETSSDDDDMTTHRPKRKSKQLRKHSTTETSSDDGNKITHRPKGNSQIQKEPLPLKTI